MRRPTFTSPDFTRLLIDTDDVAIPKTNFVATASSTYVGSSDYAASFAVDGEYVGSTNSYQSGFWHPDDSDSASPHQWLQVLTHACRTIELRV